jgi:polyisoprenoid-binding protein YceI
MNHSPSRRTYWCIRSFRQRGRHIQVDPFIRSCCLAATSRVANTYGRFNDISGTVVFDRDNPSKSSVELWCRGKPRHAQCKREQSLKSPDFFDAKQFPTLIFTSTKVEGSGDMLKVSGDLTIHGVTKPLTVDFKKGGEGKGVFGEMRAGAKRASRSSEATSG